jgi:hypothetical protein
MKPPQWLFGQTAILKSFNAVNAFGEKVYNQITTLDPFTIVSYDSTNGEYTIKCRFEPSVASDRAPLDVTKSYIGTLFVLGTDIPTQSTIEFEGRKYIVGQCIKHYSPTGISHLEVLLQ